MINLEDKWKLMSLTKEVRHPFDPDAQGIAVELSQENKSIVVFFFEDPNDGYRSSMSAPIIFEGEMYDLGGTPRLTYINKDIRIESRANSTQDGYRFLLEDTKTVFLEIGTDHTDDYYPCFICEYTPENLGKLRDDDY